MDLDNEHMDRLAAMPTIEFERERCRMIGEFLDSLPKEKRLAALEFQFSIDARRETMSREQFIASLFRDIGENLENLSDQFVAIQHCLIAK